MRGIGGRKVLKKVVAWALIGVMLLNESTIVLAEELKAQAVEQVQEFQEEQEFDTQKEKIDEQVIPKQEDVKEPVVQEKQEPEVKPESEIESEAEVQPTTYNYPQVEDVVDEEIKALDARYGEPIEMTEHERVYQVSETEFITHLTSEPNLIEKEGKETEIDLTLELKTEAPSLLSRMGRMFSNDGTSEAESQYYTPVASEVDIQLPVAVSKEAGIRIESEGNVLEVFPETGVYGNSTVLENAILYNEVKPGIDVQYTVTK